MTKSDTAKTLSSGRRVEVAATDDSFSSPPSDKRLSASTPRDADAGGLTPADEARAAAFRATLSLLSAKAKDHLHGKGNRKQPAFRTKSRGGTPSGDGSGVAPPPGLEMPPGLIVPPIVASAEPELPGSARPPRSQKGFERSSGGQRVPSQPNSARGSFSGQFSGPGSDNATPAAPGAGGDQAAPAALYRSRRSSNSRPDPDSGAGDRGFGRSNSTRGGSGDVAPEGPLRDSSNDVLPKGPRGDGKGPKAQTKPAGASKTAAQFDSAASPPRPMQPPSPAAEASGSEIHTPPAAAPPTPPFPLSAAAKNKSAQKTQQTPPSFPPPQHGTELLEAEVEALRCQMMALLQERSSLTEERDKYARDKASLLELVAYMEAELASSSGQVQEAIEAMAGELEASRAEAEALRMQLQLSQAQLALRGSREELQAGAQGQAVPAG